MLVRAAVVADAREIARIQVRGWRAAYPGIVPDAYLASMSFERSEAMWRTSIEKARPQMAVACDDAGLAGWLAYGPSRDEGAAADVAEIWAIYVDPDRLGQGIGGHLWRHVEAALIGQAYRSVVLWAFPQNLRAGRFYRSIGFEVEAGSTKTFKLGGKELDEIRFWRGLCPFAAQALPNERAPGGSSA